MKKIGTKIGPTIFQVLKIHMVIFVTVSDLILKIFERFLVLIILLSLSLTTLLAYIRWVGAQQLDMIRLSQPN